eukprot:NODE_2050_length_1215_cov_22.680961_g1703_i0.p1 GENE.NODE_2050_length_1215_cov_22.680961_g1703_i0~~NODE_2050_length_1215_cov_22.680961_g1703_i0.p1  ORF type:complete len:331 (-),score=104.40 NODE_2050_length_1215_cov_22.680961_g1703_i0:117-1109(-)
MTTVLSRFKEKKKESQKAQESASKRLFNLNDHKLTDDYKLEGLLGKGSFATVKKAVQKKTGAVHAVKIIDKTAIDVKVDSLKTEVAILMNIKHPNIVNLLEVYEDDTHVFLVMELMTGGELFDRICNDFPNGYSEAQSAALIRCVIEAIAYLHGQGVIHRDLKPENLLFATDDKESTTLKISDFGLAKIWSGDTLVKTACGSPNYVAPEVLLNDMKGYSAACDMWSIGVILYVLLCGFCPFYDENTPALFRSIISGKFTFPSPYWDHISDDAKDLISKLLVTDAKKRMTPEEALQHAWLRNTQSSTPISHITENMKKFASDRSRASFSID